MILAIGVDRSKVNNKTGIIRCHNIRRWTSTELFLCQTSRTSLTVIFLRYELEKRLRSVYVRLAFSYLDIYTKPHTFSFMKIRKWLWKITVFDQFLALLFAEKINELALILKRRADGNGSQSRGKRWFLGDLFVVMQIAEVFLHSWAYCSTLQKKNCKI